MKKTVLLVSSKAITLNNFFDEIVSSKRYDFILASSDPQNIKLKNSKIKIFLDFTILKIINPIFFLSNLIKNFYILKKLNFEYLIINTPLAALYFRIIGFLLKKKIIYIVHGFRFHKSESGIKSFFFKIYEKIFSLITNHYIVLNREDLKVVITDFGKNKKNVLQIPSIGISYKKLIDTQPLKKNNNFNVGVIAAYRKNKGYPALIKIARELQKKKLILNFIVMDTIIKKNIYKKSENLSLII